MPVFLDCDCHEQTGCSTPQVRTCREYFQRKHPLAVPATGYNTTKYLINLKQRALKFQISVEYDNIQINCEKSLLIFFL